MLGFVETTLKQLSDLWSPARSGEDHNDNPIISYPALKGWSSIFRHENPFYFTNFKSEDGKRRSRRSTCFSLLIFWLSTPDISYGPHQSLGLCQTVRLLLLWIMQTSVTSLGCPPPTPPFPYSGNPSDPPLLSSPFGWLLYRR